MTSVESFDHYQQLATRTMKESSEFEVLLHCTMGMMGEAGEVAELPREEKDKRIMEIGDCLWYAANLATVTKWRMSGVLKAVTRVSHMAWDDLSRHEPEMRALLWAARLTDVVKKAVFYGKHMPKDEMRKCLTCYVSALLDLIAIMGVEPLYVATRNIQKLEARYPSLKFDSDRAINRDTANEESKSKSA